MTTPLAKVVHAGLTSRADDAARRVSDVLERLQRKFDEDKPEHKDKSRNGSSPPEPHHHKGNE